jgi:cysteine synthase
MRDTLAHIIEVHAPVKVVPLGPPNLAALDFRLMKVFPAYNIIRSGRERGQIRANTPIVETSSGTMAAGLAIVCKHYDLRLHIFGDRAIEPPLKRMLEELGAEVVIVEAKNSDANVQNIRLAALNRFMEKNDAFWAHQYDNVDNRLAYYRPAAEAILQLGRIDILVATVGSGGSSCGLAHYIRKFFPKMMLVGVDTFGSVLFGQPPGTRVFRGLGNSIHPRNLDHTAFDWVHWLGANEGFHAARQLLRETTLKRGPTSGAAHKIAKWCAQRYPDKQVLAVFPDDGGRYEHTVFDPAWMRANGFRADRLVAAPRLVTDPRQANGEWAMINWRRRRLRDVIGAGGELQAVIGGAEHAS